LEWLGENKKAEALENAVADVIGEGKVRTYDMGGNSTTLEMAEAIAEKCRYEKDDDSTKSDHGATGGRCARVP
jgi:isocitrate/isopropylmalate dehydrogenase